MAENAIAREIFVADAAHLGAIDQALPGDVITLADGHWNDAVLQVRKGGVANRPVVVRAATPGGVVLGGSSWLSIEAPFVTVEGLRFEGGSLTKGAVIFFKSHDGLVRDTAVIGYNPPDYHTAYNWVLFSGSHNRLEHCFFKGKTNLHALVENGEPDCRYNVVAGCYFKDVPLRARVNGREIVKVLGVGHVNASAPDGAYFTLEGNLFEHTDGEGVEIVSLKSNFNQVLGNTIVASVGSLNIRRGSDNVVRGNVILGRGVSGAQGIRMSGERNLVAGNFISGCDYGIALSSGEYWAKPLTPAYAINDRDGSAENKARYPQNRRVTIADNITTRISGADLDVGVREYKKHWPENQNVLLPEECRIERNTFVRPDGGVSVIGMVPDAKPPLDQFSFKPNTYADNLLYGGRNDFAPAAAGCREQPVPPEWSEETALAGFKPLTAADVGPSWMHAK
jgi:poly(beta-D-mannuronate) lyase